MPILSAYQVIFALCGLIIVSYLFTWLNRATRIPSVLLLLGLGIGLRFWANEAEADFAIPGMLVEIFGTIGLIMIVLEAGLDLSLTKEKGPLISRSFFSALVIFLVSTALVAAALHWFFPTASLRSCIVYAIPLSIISSAIVLPSVHHLGEEKKEFLIYEASFSDIIGIMVFNYIASDHELTLGSSLWFWQQHRDFDSIVYSLVFVADVAVDPQSVGAQILFVVCGADLDLHWGENVAFAFFDCGNGLWFGGQQLGLDQTILATKTVQY